MLIKRFETILTALKTFRWEDFADIVLVAIVIFYVIRLIRGTRSVQVFLGLIPVVALAIVSSRLQFFTLSFLLSLFINNFFIILVIIFSTDIRRGLARAGRFSFFSKTHSTTVELVKEVVRAAFFMAEKRTGALIVFERNVSLGEYMETGARLSAIVSDRLLLAIFNTHAPLHDGAAIIQNGRLEMAGCFLPLLPLEDTASRFFGTRHRAAIGLSRETDAVVVVVSEEKGLVSLVRDGEVEVMMGAVALQDKLLYLMGLAKPSKKKPLGRAPK
jgi:diadenylate cyclase